MKTEDLVFNGPVGVISKLPLRANVGETARLFFGVDSPNVTSSFHKVYNHEV